MLAIARGLMSEPRLLLLDEPSLGLAPLMVERVLESVLALRDDGVTVLLVEQNAHRAIELADRTYVLRTGQIGCAGRGTSWCREPSSPTSTSAWRRAPMTSFVQDVDRRPRRLGQLLRPVRARHRPHLRHHAARQLRPRRADHGRRLRRLRRPGPGPGRSSSSPSIRVVVVLALLIERVAFRPVRGRSAATLLITSFAVSFFLQSLARIVFTTLPKSADITPLFRESFEIGDLQDQLAERHHDRRHRGPARRRSRCS